MQERTTLKRLWLWDLGYRKGLIMEVGSCFTPLETLPSDHTPPPPHTKLQLTVYSEVFLCYKQVRMIDEMINIICDPLELWKYATDGLIENRNSRRQTSTFLVRF